MAYYAALASLVELLKEMSQLSEHQYPKFLLEKQEIIHLYGKSRHLQELLEDFSPNDEEAAGLLDRIRDAACQAQDLIESRIPDSACPAREIIECRIPKVQEIIESRVPDAAYGEKFNTQLTSYIPDAVQEVQSVVELKIATKIHQQGCLYFVSACHNSETANREAVYTMRGCYEDLGKLTRECGSIIHEGYKILAQLIQLAWSTPLGRKICDLLEMKEELNLIVINQYQDMVNLKEEFDAIVEKEYHDLNRVKKAVDSILGRGNQNLERLKEAVDSIVGELYKHLLQGMIEVVESFMKRGYQLSEGVERQVDSIMKRGDQDWEIVKAEVDFVVKEGYQELVKLNEEFDATVGIKSQTLHRVKEEIDSIVGKGYQYLERMKEEIDSIVGKGYQYLERMKEKVDFVVEKSYKFLFDKVKEGVDSIVGRGYQLSERVKEQINSIVGREYRERTKGEVDSIVIEGYQNLVKLKEELDAITGMGHQDLKRVKEVVDSIVGRAHQDLERVTKELDSVVEKGYKYIFEKVKEEVDSIVEDLTRVKEKSHTTHQDVLQVSVGESTQRPSDGTHMVGFKEHLITILGQLCRESSRLEVISIVGMGRIGKTTLARNIFDDKLIDDQFDFRAWVTVSQSYNLRNILLAIANSLNININEESHGFEDGVLKKHIFQHLFGRRYLIVMDDVWNLKIWNDVKWIFPNDNKSRSRIIITTRQSDVASPASESEFKNKIPVLEYDQSWDLFREKVDCPRELEDIGRSIVKKCGGLPLAIVVVAGLLSKVNTTWSDWEEVAKGLSSTAAANDEHFSKIFSLSYNYLPHHLKPCFLYFGGFPEDHEISISKLIKLWIAEGFPKPSPSKGLEEVAEEYLEELVERNLVLITKRRSNGKFKCCSIHDLLRDLCSERAYHEQFLFLPHKHMATGHIHRVFIHHDSSSNIPMPENDFLHIRSFLSFGDKQSHVSSHSSNFKPLRVLDAPHIDFNFSPNEVFEWLNLRYLVLLCSDSSEFHIPSSILKLQHLQTLIVVSSYWQALVSLPSEIWKLPRLKHVMSDQITLPSKADVERSIQDRVLSLGALQTLSTLVDFEFNHETVQMMPSMKKLKLQFSRFERGENAWEKFGIKYLFDFPRLETLDINIVKEQLDVTPFPQSFLFPSSLKKLNLKGCMLPWEDMMVVSLLPNLQVLNLRWDSFVGEEWDPKEGEFPKLKFLLLDSLTSLKYWRAESTHFPCLEHLVIRYCHDLEGIPLEIGDFPSLRLIEVRSCNSSVKSSALEIQEEQSGLGNDILQVRAR